LVLVKHVRSRQEHPVGKHGEGGRTDFTHNEIGQSITYNFMRYFRDDQISLDLSPIAGRARPSQYNFAIEDRDQPEYMGRLDYDAFGIVTIV
jgi:hypothetical protein